MYNDTCINKSCLAFSGLLSVITLPCIHILRNNGFAFLPCVGIVTGCMLTATFIYYRCSRTADLPDTLGHANNDGIMRTEEGNVGQGRILPLDATRINTLINNRLVNMI